MACSSKGRAFLDGRSSWNCLRRGANKKSVVSSSLAIQEKEDEEEEEEEEEEAHGEEAKSQPNP